MDITMNGKEYRVTRVNGCSPNLFFAWEVEYKNEKNEWREVRNTDMKFRLIKKAGGMKDRVI